MKIQEILAVFIDQFKQKSMEFCAFKGFSDAHEASPEDCSAIGDMLWESVFKGGTQAMTRYMESCDTQTATIIADGVKMKYKLKSVKEFHVGFGVAAVSRRLYQSDAGGACASPLDIQFNMVDEYALPDVRESVLHASALLKPEDITETMADFRMPPMSATAVKRIILGAGAKLEAHRLEIESDTSLAERLPDGVLALVGSMDGTSTRIRDKPSQSGYKYKVRHGMAMCGTVGVYGKPEVLEDGIVRMERLESSAFGRMPEERFPTFKSAFDSEVAAVSARLPASIPRILLMDGATSLWHHVEGNPLYNGFLRLIDYFHMKEHLVAASESLFGVGMAAGTQWVEKWEATLLEEDGSAEGVHRSIQYYCKRKRLSKARLKEAETHATYFRNNYTKMNYAWFRDRGLPIGSGPVEACCKTLVKGRLCLSGMSWSDEGGQAILTLRAHRKYGDWDRMWNSYLHHQRLSLPKLELAA
jgi:hypothetical protein